MSEKNTVTPRRCVDCGVDISGEHPGAIRCPKHQRQWGYYHITLMNRLKGAIGIFKGSSSRHGKRIPPKNIIPQPATIPTPQQQPETPQIPTPKTQTTSALQTTPTLQTIPAPQTTPVSQTTPAPDSSPITAPQPTPIKAAVQTPPASQPTPIKPTVQTSLPQNSPPKPTQTQPQKQHTSLFTNLKSIGGGVFKRKPHPPKTTAPEPLIKTPESAPSKPVETTPNLPALGSKLPEVIAPKSIQILQPQPQPPKPPVQTPLPSPAPQPNTLMPEEASSFTQVVKEFANMHGIGVDAIDIDNLVGTAAGEVYYGLAGKDIVLLEEAMSGVQDKEILFPAALGWLLREGRIEMNYTPQGITLKMR